MHILRDRILTLLTNIIRGNRLIVPFPHSRQWIQHHDHGGVEKSALKIYRTQKLWKNLKTLDKLFSLLLVSIISFLEGFKTKNLCFFILLECFLRFGGPLVCFFMRQFNLFICFCYCLVLLHWGKWNQGLPRFRDIMMG